jgi:hypothetical protein
MRSLAPILLFPLLLAACVAEPPPSENAAAALGSSATEIRFDWLTGREVHEPRLVVDRTGALLIAWRQKAEEGSDVFIARRGADGQFGEPVQANDEPGTVESYPHDEMRPAVATGPDGRLAVAWSDSRGQVRAAESRDGGATFSPSFRLEQIDEPSYRGFPELVYDDKGVLHAVWIDSRFAEGMAEEPADLFYARIADGEVVERNLTADQEPTVCGCCRPAIEIAETGEPRMVFRNADADGYRDIFSVTGAIETGFSQPRRLGHPLWKLQGCPMSGPATAGGSVLWPDGSTGRKQIMVAGYDSPESTPLFVASAGVEWSPRLSPRRVSSTGAGELLLLPGRSTSRVMVRGEAGWAVVEDDLPPWASSAHFSDGALLLVGAVNGELKTAIRLMTPEFRDS